MSASNLTIHGLEISNFMGVRAVALKPDGTVYEITGKNGSGKTSVIRAIWAALGGREHAPERPIRAGEKRAEVTLDLGDLRVTRSWTGPEASSLKVTSRDGLKYPTPQKVLDALIGRLSFDPLSFDRLDDGTAKGKRAQAAMLRELARLDTADLDAERAAVYAERAAVNGQVDRLRGVVDSIPVAPVPEEVGEEQSVAELAKRHGEALAAVRANDNVRAEARRLAAAVGEAVKRHEVALAQVDAARAALEAAERTAEEMRKAASAAHAAAIEAQIASAALVDPDTGAITAEMEGVEAHNASVRDGRAAAQKAAAANAQREAKAAELVERRREADALTDKLRSIDEHKAQRLAAVRFPVEGLSVEGDVVSFEGVPLSQINTANRIRIGLAIGAAMNPGLRFVTIEHGNDIGAETMATVAEWAQQAGYQVIVERIAGTGAAGVEIADGEVVAETQPAPAQGQQSLGV